MIEKNSLFLITMLLLSSLLLAIALPVFGQTVFIPAGATWKFLDDGSDQDTLWRETGFDDGAWDAGPAQLGYGDGDESTVVTYGPDPDQKYVTTYFRHAFTVSDPSQFSYLFLRLLRDDGAAVYLNGSEITRSNMPGGEIEYLTFAASTVGGDEENIFYEDYLSAGDLIAGTNVLAVEIHQRNATSSDISFDLELQGLAEIPHPVRKTPYLIYAGNNREMKVLWQLVCSDTCRIDWGPDTSYSLGGASTYEYGDDHQHAYTIENLTPSTKYYYRIIAEADTFPGSFSTAPYSNVGEARFFAYGDCRTYPADHNIVAGAINSSLIAHPSSSALIISVGDLNSDGDLEDDWDSEFFASSYSSLQTMLADIPYQCCMGNHEGTGELFEKYFPYPYVADRYWSFDYGPVHFVMIDQYVDYSSGSAQHAWIASDLASTSKPWKMVVLHEPGWTAGGGHENNATVQNDIQPLCELHGVSIVFGGHNHYYARAVVNGIHHITTGGGGAPLHTPNLGYPNIVAGASAYHYCDIEIDDGSLSFVAVSTSGDTLDEFTVAGTVTAVEMDEEKPPFRKFVLHDAFPNPFNPQTTISFTIPAASRVELNIYDVNGRKVRTLVQRELAAGRFSYSWDGKNDAGRRVDSGLYFCVLNSGEKTQSKKLLLLR